MQPKIILASQSTGRKNLLTRLGIPFEIIPSNIDEDHITGSNPIETLHLRAHAKAKQVIKLITYNQQLTTNNYLIIAADSSAIYYNKIYGKAKNKQAAKRIVLALMGHTHTFVTATSIHHLKYFKLLKKLKTLNSWDNITKTRVTLRRLKPKELDQYLSRYNFTRFAAGYSLDHTPWDLVTKIDGSYTNVVGLPFEVLLPIFRETKLL